jgi:NAD(P)H-flavin reductase
MLFLSKRALKYPVKIAIVASGTGTAPNRGIITYDKSGARTLLTMTVDTKIATAVGTAYGVGN